MHFRFVSTSPFEKPKCKFLFTCSQKKSSKCHVALLFERKIERKMKETIKNTEKDKNARNKVLSNKLMSFYVLGSTFSILHLALGSRASRHIHELFRVSSWFDEKNSNFVARLCPAGTSVPFLFLKICTAIQLLDTFTEYRPNLLS